MSRTSQKNRARLQRLMPLHAGQFTPKQLHPAAPFVRPAINRAERRLAARNAKRRDRGDA